MAVGIYYNIYDIEQICCHGYKCYIVFSAYWDIQACEVE